MTEKLQSIKEVSGNPQAGQIAGQYEEFPPLPEDSPFRPKTREEELDDILPIKTPIKDHG